MALARNLRQERLRNGTVASPEEMRVQEMSFLRITNSQNFVLGGRGVINGVGQHWSAPGRANGHPLA